MLPPFPPLAERCALIEVESIDKTTLCLPQLASAAKMICQRPRLAVRPEGAKHQWRRVPPRELSIDLVADERFGRVTGRAGAS